MRQGRQSGFRLRWALALAGVCLALSAGCSWGPVHAIHLDLYGDPSCLAPGADPATVVGKTTVRANLVSVSEMPVASVPTYGHATFALQGHDRIPLHRDCEQFTVDYIVGQFSAYPWCDTSGTPYREWQVVFAGTGEYVSSRPLHPVETPGILVD